MGSVVYNSDYRLGISQVSDKYFDLAICDIPYGINVTNMAYIKERKTTVKQKNGVRLNPHRHKEIIQHTDWDTQVPGQDYFDELVRVSKIQIIFGVEYTSWQKVGTGRIIWNKCVPDGMSFSSTEVAYCSAIEDTIEIQLLWSGMMQAKSLSESTTPQGNKKLNERRIHPCHKPILLYRQLIRQFGFEGCKIVDTHLGGGSHRIAAYLENCDFTAWEINKVYFDKQERRFNEFTSQLSITFQS